MLPLSELTFDTDIVLASVIISAAVSAQASASTPRTDCAVNPPPISRMGYLSEGKVSMRGGRLCLLPTSLDNGLSAAKLAILEVGLSPRVGKRERGDFWCFSRVASDVQRKIEVGGVRLSVEQKEGCRTPRQRCQGR